jgi:hypothetical protein
MGILFLVLYLLSILCLVIASYNNRNTLGVTVCIVLCLILTICLTNQSPFLLPFVLFFVLVFQLIFIIYWTLRYYNHKKIALVFVSFSMICLLAIIFQPWISDLLFNKNDVRIILKFHQFKLKDDFKIIKNETEGLTDYYEMFTIKISNKDFDSISKKIEFFNSKKDTFTKVENAFYYEYYSKNRMENGTYHFVVSLNKEKQELNYVGSDE